MKFRSVHLILAACFGVGCCLVVAEADDELTFNHDIRPILSNNCFFCHGPDDKHREADLRLDTSEGATRDLGGYAAVVPGKPDESVLLARVSSHDPDEMMPPPASKKPQLSAEAIAILRRWIAEGAEYQGHWAFLPISSAPPPDVKGQSWVRNPIDRIVLSRLEQAGIQPSPEADRHTLIRRVSLDLIGLLPSPEEVIAFVADERPQAYEELVDRLLASPHYGERWGRHWLDQARYADSHGYAIDGEREMWAYRDWVIHALNTDMPYDRFTVEQLAGDLLPGATKSQLVATAFHRNTLINQEGGSDREQFRVESVMDRVNTTGAVWLGLTVGCAQCHSHKFDPITQREYYELLAFFNSTQDANDAGPTVEVAAGEMFGKSATSVEFTEGGESILTSDRAAWERQERDRLEALLRPDAPPVLWMAPKYLDYGTASNASFTRLDDNSLLSDGRGSFNDTYRILATTDLPRIAAVRLRVLTDESLPKRGPGRAANGNFVLTNFTVQVGEPPAPFVRAFTDHEQPDYSVQAAIDDDAKSGWAINVGPESTATMNANHEAVFVLSKPIEPAGKPLKLQLFHDADEGYLIGRFALEFSAVEPLESPEKAAALLAALRVSEAQRTVDDRSRVETAFACCRQIAAASAPVKPSETARLMIMGELEQPRKTFLLTRGDFTRPDASHGELDPGAIRAVAPPLDVQGRRPNRLDLARWLVSPENPLTPRVTINRVWMRYFGRGLVETEDDFGTQGSMPTHPELLDWLAHELILRGWSMKAMHRLIVTSATYRQTSHVRKDLNELDPRNLLLARQERCRVEAEITRDMALCASGLLNRTLGGPSVHPPQPEGVYVFTQTSKNWPTDEGGNRYRRGLYTFFYRSASYPLLTTFDAPNFQSVCTRRGRSNTPLQALTLANDVAFVELARGLALRLMREVPGTAVEVLEARLRRGFLVCLCREPSSSELASLRDYTTRQAEHFLSEPAAAQSLLGGSADAGARPHEAAALVCAARVLLNTDNFITRE